MREISAGVVVRGARIVATMGPMRSPSTRRASVKMTEGHHPFAVTFAIPCSTPGLRFLCRESFDRKRSHFDYPLASRFEEMDCLVFFDDVLVPWERVFLLGDIDLVNGTGLKNPRFEAFDPSGRSQESCQV
jgi:4-hydroxyphenylacetate 3-monooxygenase